MNANINVSYLSEDIGQHIVGDILHPIFSKILNDHIEIQPKLQEIRDRKRSEDGSTEQ